MSDILKVKYKIGEIVFEAEGDSEFVEQQRDNFINEFLPTAAKAIKNAKSAVNRETYIIV